VTDEDKDWISGIDLHLRAAFLTELSNLNAREETHTDEDVIVINYLNKRLKEIEKKKSYST
tara:strand:- start:140 stop:322 length:183 start_codon:yes stop_codon:yes gene_type:complete